MNKLDFNIKNSNIKFIMLNGFIVLALSVLLCSFISAKSNYINNSKNNMLYVQILNYTMPTIKQVSFDQESMAESQFSAYSLVTYVTGINFKDPHSILSKELSVLKTNSVGSETSVIDSTNDNKIISLQPFKLGNDAISKNNVPDSNQATNTQPPQNQTPQPSVNGNNTYEPTLRSAQLSTKPQVFIYHTHTRESYAPGPPDSEDQSHNICAVGDMLTSILQQDYNISVIHDKTDHESVYYQAYTRSGETVDKYLKQYGDFNLIIDMHRDSIEQKSAVTTKINNESVASFDFVMCKANPHYSNNISVVNKLIDISNKLYPSFCRGVYPYNYGTNFFNQAKSNNACLIEIGSQVNTTDEAKASAKYLSRIIAEYFNGKK